MKNTNEITLKSVSDLQQNYKVASEVYLSSRFSDNPEFQKQFVKTFSDMVFSMEEQQLELLSQMKQNSLLNAVFKATEIGASFAKKQISIIPFAKHKKEVKNGVERSIPDGYTATLVIDINYQKQMILSMPNCAKFFSTSVHEGIKVIKDLNSGNTVFIGDNDVSGGVVGYYACFIDKNGVKTDLFMSNEEIIERAKMNPGFKADLYKNPRNNVHFDKIVVRNLIKIIPNTTKELQSIVAVDEVGSDFADVMDVTNLQDESKSLETVKSKLAKLDNPKNEQKTDEKEQVKEQGEEVDKPSINDYFTI